MIAILRTFVLDIRSGLEVATIVICVAALLIVGAGAYFLRTNR